jgi:hypothetical protein
MVALLALTPGKTAVQRPQAVTHTTQYWRPPDNGAQATIERYLNGCDSGEAMYID